MRKYTVTLEHVTYAHIRESFPVYAASLDEALEAAHRQCGNWFRIVGANPV